MPIGALETGLAEAAGDYVLTLDADLSHDPDFISKRCGVRARARATSWSRLRYTRGGVTYTSFIRNWTSFVLNLVLGRMLSVPCRDMSSGSPLSTAARRIRGNRARFQNFEVQEEVRVRAYALRLQHRRGAVRLLSARRRAFSRQAAQLRHRHRPLGSAALEAAQLPRFLRFRRARLLQHHPDSALLASPPPPSDRRDVGARHRPHPRRRMWFQHDDSEPQQRRRDGLQSRQASSAFFAATRCSLVRGSAFALPFSDQSFDCLISQEVIEHLPYDEVLFTPRCAAC